MASSLTLKRFTSSKHLSSSIRPLRVVSQPLFSRLFNTNAVGESAEITVITALIAAVSSPRSLCFFHSQLGTAQAKLLQGKTPPAGDGLNGKCDVKETADGLEMRFDMPGIGKEGVNVSVEQNTMVVKIKEGERTDVFHVNVK